MVLFNIANFTFEQIEVSNHNTSGLVCFNSQITFDGNSIFLNKSDIYGGGIALYESSRLLLLNEHTNKTVNISVFNNFASVSGGGIFVSQVVDVKKVLIVSLKLFLIILTIILVLSFILSTIQLPYQATYYMVVMSTNVIKMMSLKPFFTTLNRQVYQ